MTLSYIALGLALAAALPDRTTPARVEDRVEDTAVARRVMRDFGRCVAREQRFLVERFLRMDRADPNLRRRAIGLATEDCLWGGNLRFREELLRGSLFEALYIRDFQSHPVDISGVPPVAYVANEDELGERHRYWLALNRLADCVVRSDPRSARSLLLSDVDTSEERDLFAAIAPRLSSCLVDGASISFSRQVLRGLIAESLYRISTSAVAVPAADATR